MRKNRKQRKLMFLLILILGITIGFALISTTLNINGIAGIKKNTWDIHWDNESVVVTPNSISGNTPIVSGTNDDTVTFETTLELPGDFYEFTVDAINEGSVDGSISLITNKTYKVVNNVEVEQALPSYIKYTVKYSDNITPAEGDVLKSNQSKTYKIRVEYDSNSEVLPSEDTTYKFKYSVKYEQYKEQIPEPRTCAQFESDSWATIKRNVSLKEDTYPVGCEKNVTLDTFGTHKVRIINNSTPSSCESDDFSQTACGFVLDFTDVLTKQQMNLSYSNVGGWEVSPAREYTNSAIYNSLPSDLKNVIINTKTISGRGSSESNDIVTNDKLYIITYKEITGVKEYNESVGDKTRQLDYYLNIGTNLENLRQKAAKQYNGSVSSNWYRSASTQNNYYFLILADSITRADPRRSEGISPLFRIGKDWVLTNSQNPIKSQKWEYYYNNKKKLQDGWYKLKDFSGNDQYYFFENGFMKLGWYTDTNNNTYYLSEMDADNNSYVDGNRVSGGVINIDGTDYTFDNNGVCTSCN